MTDASLSSPDASPDATPPAVQTAHRWLLVIVMGMLAASLPAGRTGAVVEVLVMVGLPLYIMARVAYARMRGLQGTNAGAETRSSRRLLLRAGRAAARSLPTFGGGFYGLVAAITFLIYQIRELSGGEWLAVEQWSGTLSRASADPFGYLTGEFAMMLWDLLLPISANWVIGLVYAAVWPLYVLQWGGVWALGAVAVLGWVYAKLAPRLWPVVKARIATRSAHVSPSRPSQNPRAPQGRRSSPGPAAEPSGPAAKTSEPSD
jgi:hypothetical protein